MKPRRLIRLAKKYARDLLKLSRPEKVIRYDSTEESACACLGHILGKMCTGDSLDKQGGESQP